VSLSRRPSRLGLIVALLALAGQVAWAASVPQPVLLLLGFGPICHADRTGTAPGRRPLLPPARAVPASCLALAMPVPLPAAGPGLPARRQRPLRIAAPGVAVAAPPALVSLASAPRGPPSLA